MHHAQGDVKEIMADMEIEDLIAEDAAETILKRIQNYYADYLEDKPQESLEKVMYSKDLHKQKNETIAMYVQRKTRSFDELKRRANIVLPDLLKGYMMLRDAHLSEKAWDSFSTWTENKITFDTVCENHKKLERPVIGHPNQSQRWHHVCRLRGAKRG